MKFGIGKEMITPDHKTHMGGYASLYGQYFKHIHDDIFLKALLLDDGNKKALLLTADLLFHDKQLAQKIKEFAYKKYGIDRQCLFISYTHNHYGPAVKGYDPFQYSEEYEIFLLKRIKSCIKKAALNTFKGKISYGATSGDWNISRRKIQDGKYVGGPYPEGDKDDLLHIFKLCDLNGKIRALFINYSCHPVTHGALCDISAGYPGRLCHILEGAFYGCTAMFFQSAGGDTRPRITAKKGKFVDGSYDDVEEMATAMAIKIKKALTTYDFTEISPDLNGIQFEIPLKLEVYPKEYFKDTYKTLSPGPLKNECKEIIKKYDDTNTDTVQLQAGILKLNEKFYIFYTGGEICYDVKRQLLNNFKDKKVIFVGFCDSTAYIPSDKIIQEGGYEAEGSVIEYMLKGKFAPGIDHNIYEHFEKNMKKL